MIALLEAKAAGLWSCKTLHDPQRGRMAVRNAERVEDRLGLLFPTLIQHLNERAGIWPSVK